MDQRTTLNGVCFRWGTVRRENDLVGADVDGLRDAAAFRCVAAVDGAAEAAEALGISVAADPRAQ